MSLRTIISRLAYFYETLAKIVRIYGGEPPVDSDPKRLAAVREALADDFNTPVVMAQMHDIAKNANKLAEKKKVVCSMGTVAASGGYWISATATHIFAEPNTVTGSIGILALLPNLKQVANEHGITWDSVKTAKFADVDGISRPKTAEEMALLQRLIDDGYERFLKLVAGGRNKTRDAVHEIAQGRVWSGRDAEKLGLVDEFGGLGKAIQYAARSAKLGTDWSVTELPEEKSFLQTLSEMLGGGKKPLARESPFARVIRETGEDLQLLRSLNDPAGVYALMPDCVRIR